MNRAVYFTEFGGPEVLRIDAVTPAPLADDEVRFDVTVFAVNRADLLFLAGTHYTIPRFPSRIGSEASGVVTEVGAAVSRFRVGDRVAAIPFFTDQYGVAASSAVVPQDYLAAIPDGVSDEQAAALWMAYLTPYFAFVDAAPVTPDGTILITAAASSAGLGALQIARLLGFRTIATTRTPAKAEILRASGADAVVVGDTDMAQSVAEVSRTGGLAAAFDPIGGDSLSGYVDLLDSGATVFGYGLLSGENPRIPVAQMCRAQAVFYPYSMFNHVGDRCARERACAHILQALADGRLEPRIDRVFEFNETVEAFRYMESNNACGKILVRI